MVPELHLPQPGAAVPLRVGVTPVNFRRAYGEYRACTARLPPAPAPKAAVVAAAPAGGGMRVAFDSNRWQLNAGAREQLDRWLGGLGATAQVAVDGHSGDSPRRVLNLELSRRRAEAVTDYLVERGVERERIVTRFHGERRAGNGARHVEVRQQHAAR
jgi:outer membrane protein OmpA-like peptidoglycan-associated protein